MRNRPLMILVITLLQAAWACWPCIRSAIGAGLVVFERPQRGSHCPESEPATIIVALHNEAPTPLSADNSFTRALSAIIDQDYPSYEVLFVNDRSTDHTGRNSERDLRPTCACTCAEHPDHPHECLPQKVGAAPGDSGRRNRHPGLHRCRLSPPPVLARTHHPPLAPRQQIAIGYSPPVG